MIHSSLKYPWIMCTSHQLVEEPGLKPKEPDPQLMLHAPLPPLMQWTHALSAMLMSQRGGLLFVPITWSKSSKTSSMCFVRKSHPQIFSFLSYSINMLRMGNSIKQWKTKKRMGMNEHMNYISHVYVAFVKYLPFVFKIHQTCKWHLFLNKLIGS